MNIRIIRLLSQATFLGIVIYLALGLGSRDLRKFLPVRGC